MKKYIKIREDGLWTNENTATLDATTMKWKSAKSGLYNCNIIEWFQHTILKKHFSFGQPYCVVCGYEELLANNK